MMRQSQLSLLLLGNCSCVAQKHLLLMTFM